MLFHVSEERGITRFEPRPSEFSSGPVVWAIDDEHLRNYLVPRDCPRVTYYAGSSTTRADIERFLGLSAAVVAIESGWLERMRSCQLYCYHLPPDTFTCLDPSAGYFVSSLAVEPCSVSVIEDAESMLLQRGVDFRVLPNLWQLHDAVVASSLEFSMIRMRNALRI
jgi:hypothetical protein